METPVALDVRGGLRLEALLALPESPKAGLVVCHPHPLYRGDMENPVVVRVAEVAQGVGMATLRFNFRGVGASGGVHAGGEGEQDDVAAALAALAGRLPAESPIGLAGYSFGAWVAARVAAAMPSLPALALVELKQVKVAQARLQYLVDNFPQSEEAPLARERLKNLGQ